MTGNALIHALAVGVAVGVLGRLVLPGRAAAPLWLTVAVGLGAALLGTITARVAGVDVAEPSVLRLVVQAVATAARAPRPARAVTRWRPAADPTSVPADQEGNPR